MLKFEIKLQGSFALAVILRELTSLSPYQIFVITDNIIFWSQLPHLPLLRLPPDPSHPPCPVLDILPLQYSLNSIPFFRQFFVGSHTVHKIVTCSAKPGNAVQSPFFVPPFFQGLGMDPLWYQVMICQWDPIPYTYDARAGSSIVPDRRSGRGGGNIFTENGLQKGRKI